ncbi:MAG: Rpn family recombination-promoting nuclease/putative transposase [Bacteroidales bacterium]|nr:Rpn family recombination-promoting nuclease/putative transposase [Bacteroidales bacterium]
MNKINYIRFDWAIKKLLRDKANFGILEGFIEVFLKKKGCKIIEILESESNQKFDDDKFNRVDIKAKDADGEIFIVEIQLTRYVNYMERVLFGAAKAVTEQLNDGDDYGKIKKIYSISIVYYDFGIGKDYLYVGETKFVGVHCNDELLISEKEELTLFEKEQDKAKNKDRKFKYERHNAGNIMPTYYLIRVNSFDDTIKTAMDEWMEFLKNSEIKSDTKVPGLVEAKEVMKFDRMTKEEQDTYIRHLDAVANEKEAILTAKIEGKIEGREEGKAEGIAQRNKEIATEMKNNGISVEVISVVMKLPVEEVKKLLNQ